MSWIQYYWVFCIIISNLLFFIISTMESKNRVGLCVFSRLLTDQIELVLSGWKADCSYSLVSWRPNSVWQSFQWQQVADSYSVAFTKVSPIFVSTLFFLILNKVHCIHQCFAVFFGCIFRSCQHSYKAGTTKK